MINTSMDTTKMQLVRGARIIQQLENEEMIHICDDHIHLHEEKTYGELERNTLTFQPKTKKRQFAMASVQVQAIEFSPIIPSKILNIKSQVVNYDSDTSTKNHNTKTSIHYPSLSFRNVEFHTAQEIPDKEKLKYADREGQDDTQPEEVVDIPGTVTLQSNTGKEFTMKPVQLSQNNVLVMCTCLDYYWRSAHWATKQGANLGQDIGFYKKKTNRPSVNPYGKAILCKHLLKLVVELKNSGAVV